VDVYFRELFANQEGCLQLHFRVSIMDKRHYPKDYRPRVVPSILVRWGLKLDFDVLAQVKVAVAPQSLDYKLLEPGLTDHVH